MYTKHPVTNLLLDCTDDNVYTLYVNDRSNDYFKVCRIKVSTIENRKTLTLCMLGKDLRFEKWLEALGKGNIETEVRTIDRRFIFYGAVCQEITRDGVHMVVRFSIEAATHHPYVLE